MSRLLWTLGFAFTAIGMTGSVIAQDPDMPGQVVSNSAGEHLKLIGKELPRAGKPVGKPINIPSGNPLLRPYNPANPYEALEGTGLSVKSVVAPVNGYSTEAPPSMFQQVSDKMKSLLGISKPPVVHNTFTPGIYRRDRQRAQERMWQRD